MRSPLPTTPLKPRLEVMVLEFRNTQGEALSYLLGWGLFPDLLAAAGNDPVSSTQAEHRDALAVPTPSTTETATLGEFAPVETNAGALPSVDLPLTTAPPSRQARLADLEVSYWASDDLRPAHEFFGNASGPREPLNPAPIGSGTGPVGTNSLQDGANSSMGPAPVPASTPGNVAAFSTISATDGTDPVPLNSFGDDTAAVPVISATYSTKLIPVNANNDNGSAWKSAALPFIPTTRDFDATNLPVDDPQLVTVTATIGGGLAGTLTVSDYAPGEALVAYWADKKKQNAFESKTVAASTTPVTVTFYLEGTHESANSGDEVRIDLKFTTANPQQMAERSDKVMVAPFFPGANSFTSTIPTPSMSFRNQGPPPNGLGGLVAGKPPAAAGGAWTAGIAFDAELTNGSLTMKYLQNFRDVQNGANGSGAGAVFTAASGFANENFLPNPGSGFTYPALDAIDPANPLYTVDFSSTATANGVTIHATDSPSPGRPVQVSRLEKLDV